MGSYRNNCTRHGAASDGAKATKDWYHDSKGSGARRSRGRGDDRKYENGWRRDDVRKEENRGRDRAPWTGRDGDKRQGRSRSRRGGHSPRGGHQTNGKAQYREKRGRKDRRDSAERSTATSEYSSSSDSRASSASGGGKAKKSADSDKDEIVHFAWQKGMLLASRYRVIKLLGDGTFGRVILATDQVTNRQVAVKVIRDVKRYAENAKIEADILKDIRRVDPRGEATRSAIMYETFAHERHFCLVFEPCGASLYDFLKRNGFRGFWLQDIQSFARQSLAALSFLHETLQMTHTDLKPENILLESLEPPRPSDFPREGSWKPSKGRASSAYLRPASPCIRLIDFGNATYEDEHHSSIINTRQYRGPEVILSLGWNERSDVWSMGCILMELYTGELLFGTHENLEHLALMERVLEPLPTSMLNGVPRGVKEKYVSPPSRGGPPRLQWPEKAQSTSSEKHVRSQRPLKNMCVDQQHSPFTAFVGYLLTLDPTKRPSATEALKHPFLSKHFPD